MIRVGRVLSWLSIATWGAPVLLLVPGVTKALGASPAIATALFWTGLVLAGCLALATWGLALFHLATRYRGKDRTLWLVVVVLTALFGAWLYWLHRRSNQADSIALSPG
jgi:hypothetical protein